MIQQLTLYTKEDLMDQTCRKCGKGYYKETSIYDDWEGKLHCDICNHEVKRHEKTW
jgi:hypothetical protein